MVWLQLLAAVGFGIFAVLVFVQARDFYVFPLRVGATEWGHFFAAGAMALAILANRQTVFGMVAAGLAGAGSLVLWTPYLRARLATRGMRTQLGEVCEEASEAQWVRFWPMFCLSHTKKPTFRRMIFEGPGCGLHLDFYPATGAREGGAPCVVVVHSGSWRAGSTEEAPHWNMWLAERGFAVAAVSYRLLPEGAWPAQKEDVLAGIRHLQDRSMELGVNPGQFVLLGRSAGGQIASALAAPGEYAFIRGCVCLYAPFDLIFAYEFGREDDALRSRGLVRDYLGGEPGDQAASYVDASAKLCATEKSPPFLLMHGPKDELVWIRQSERFSARLRELGVRHAFVRLPWATHVFDFNLHGPGGQVTKACLRAFLAEVTAVR